MIIQEEYANATTVWQQRKPKVWARGARKVYSLLVNN